MPYLLPALRLAAASAVIGTVVAEVSIGLRGGIGRMIIEYAQTASGDPAKPGRRSSVPSPSASWPPARSACSGLLLRPFRLEEVAR